MFFHENNIKVCNCVQDMTEQRGRRALKKRDRNVFIQRGSDDNYTDHHVFWLTGSDDNYTDRWDVFIRYCEIKRFLPLDSQKKKSANYTSDAHHLSPFHTSIFLALPPLNRFSLSDSRDVLLTTVGHTSHLSPRKWGMGEGWDTCSYVCQIWKLWGNFAHETQINSNMKDP